MKKKIFFFLYSLSGGGAERTVINIMNNLDARKYEIILVLGTQENNDYEELLSENINVKILNCKKLRYCLFALRKQIIKEKPDLLFSTINSNNIMLLMAKILSFKRIPIIVREANNRTQSGKVTVLNKVSTYIFYNLVADKIIALSKGVKTDLIENFNVRKNKITVIYNPVENKKILKLSKEVVTDLSKEEGEQLIIAAGRLVEQKDYPTLIKAFHIVSQKVNARLIIMGKGELEDKLLNLCRKLEVEEKVDFIGFKKNPYKYMRIADVFVLSSKWEGFGHVLVESMATGTPVISTNCKSGPSEIIGDNKYGLLVPVKDSNVLADNLEKILMNENEKNKFSKLGKIRSAEFDAKIITEQYDNVFSQFL
ncbi:glycosyltransferase [Gracilibacillus sp. S3-1-1]|uniref:Glycosyltransferase n=1 Tax=Gracilibacillus pellucidus TaxID=3095368 RepID=A0ACC6M8N1_9BACI|nr:glycosyltransferase [Gracilibacillus sp. S3-1-1]MDX8047127.1 glycosyltransferase [Gracilibacillus sp. S3-1-1]